MDFNNFVDIYRNYLDENYLTSNRPCAEKSYVSNAQTPRQFSILRDEHGIDLAQVRRDKTVIIF